MMKNRKSIVLALVVVSMIFSQLVYASSSWTDARTWSLSGSDDTYKTITTTGSKLGATKTTDETEWDVYTVSKTMYTYPKAKLVNSNGATRSDVVTTVSSGRYVTGSVNTGTIGYAEYLAVKPSALQMGTDTIKLQFRNY